MKVIALADNVNELDLVIADDAMPRMTGDDMVVSIRQRTERSFPGSNCCAAGQPWGGVLVDFGPKDINWRYLTGLPSLRAGRNCHDLMDCRFIVKSMVSPIVRGALLTLANTTVPRSLTTNSNVTISSGRIPDGRFPIDLGRTSSGGMTSPSETLYRPAGTAGAASRAADTRGAGGVATTPDAAVALV